MAKLDNFRVPDPKVAFANFEVGLRRALKLSKEELDRRVSAANASRAADQIQKGHGKRGRKRTSTPTFSVTAHQ